jgi:hypothetical protein
MKRLKKEEEENEAWMGKERDFIIREEGTMMR